MPNNVIPPNGNQVNLVRVQVEDIAAQAKEHLRGVETSPFSPAAFEGLQRHISDYVSDLVTQSAVEAKRAGLDTISEKHVDHANEYLAANSGRNPFRHVGTIGGIFLGAAVSNLLAIASASTPATFTSIALTTALGILGSFAVALHIAKD